MGCLGNKKPLFGLLVFFRCFSKAFFNWEEFDNWSDYEFHPSAALKRNTILCKWHKHIITSDFRTSNPVFQHESLQSDVETQKKKSCSCRIIVSEPQRLRCLITETKTFIHTFLHMQFSHLVHSEHSLISHGPKKFCLVTFPASEHRWLQLHWPQLCCSGD